MLEPQERKLLLETLRPPDEFELDFGIATTFTLDLLSLLTAPLGFSFFELEGDASEAAGKVDPLLLLRTIRRYSERLAVFCQAGRIAVPRKQQLLFAHLEESVVEVTPSSPDGVFHPKVWILRYTHPDGRVHYRLINLSRNLTFDRSWDTVLVLDGPLVDRKVAYAVNHPLGDFVQELPNLAVDPTAVPEWIRGNIERASAELRRVDFDVPDPFDSYCFIPLGIPGHASWPFEERSDRSLIVSPFLSADVVRALGTKGKGNVLISRFDELQTLSKADLTGFEHVYALDPAAGSELSSEGETESDPFAPTAGLHAKLFVFEVGRNALVYTGSANATAAGVGQNVEFLVELGGRKVDCGVDAILGAPEGVPSLLGLVKPFEPLDEPVACDPSRQVLERRLEAARRALSERSWIAHVISEDGERFEMALEPAAGDWPRLDSRVIARCRPITLHESAGRSVGIEEVALHFGPLTLEALTSFIAFDLESSEAGTPMSLRFVTTARLVGSPADRGERLLRHHLRDPQQLIRFLLLLLATQDTEEGTAVDGNSWSAGGSAGWQNGATDALLEPLLRALADNPGALDQVANALEELRKTADGSAIIPAGLERIWIAVWAARQHLRPT